MEKITRTERIYEKKISDRKTRIKDQKKKNEIGTSNYELEKRI